MNNNAFMTWWEANQEAFPTFKKAREEYYFVARDAYVDAGMAKYPTMGRGYFAAKFHDEWVEAKGWSE
jgi:hypothetical protein